VWRWEQAGEIYCPQLLTESLLLAALGACRPVGAQWAISLLLGAMPKATCNHAVPAGRVDQALPVLAFLTAVTVLTAMIFGLRRDCRWRAVR